MRKKLMKIYKKRWHLAITLLIVLFPFLFFLVFSGLANIPSTKLLLDILISGWRLLAAYLIAAVMAWCLAVLFHQEKFAAVALPIFDVLQSFPTFAALPLAVFFFGPSNFTIIFFLVLTVIWPILFSIVSSLKLIRQDWEEAAIMSRLSGLDYLRYFLWPVSVTGLITGSIIGLGEGWEALVATEIIVGIKTGLGSFFQQFSNNANVTIFGILGFLALIFSINKLVWLPLLEWGHHETEE
ncbi:MAG: ABC transporter permease subunit [Candidatus Harrisonbacteria bacterium]|nr:ABC transporter permease subunit [Candidatus Harrisonbacteria bacterium]